MLSAAKRKNKAFKAFWFFSSLASDSTAALEYSYDCLDLQLGKHRFQSFQQYLLTGRHICSALFNVRPWAGPEAEGQWIFPFSHVSPQENLIIPLRRVVFVPTADSNVTLEETYYEALMTNVPDFDECHDLWVRRFNGELGVKVAAGCARKRRQYSWTWHLLVGRRILRLSRFVCSATFLPTCKLIFHGRVGSDESRPCDGHVT